MARVMLLAPELEAVELFDHPKYFHIGHDEIRDAVDQRMRKSLLDGVFAPAEIFHALFTFPFDLPGNLDKPLGGVRAAVPDHVFHALADVHGNVGVHAELSGVHDAHVKARADGVVQKH